MTAPSSTGSPERHRRARSARLLVVLVCACLLVVDTAVAAPDDPATQDHGDAAIQPGRVPPPPLLFSQSAHAHGNIAAATAAAWTPPPNTDFILSYSSTVDAQSRQVFEAAAGIWSATLEVTVPIRVEVHMPSMSPGFLGAAGPNWNWLSGSSGFPRPNTIYPIALANQIAGVDLDTDPADGHDIDVFLSSSVAWDKTIGGTDGGQSMLSVAVHELGHGLGHTTNVTDQRFDGSGSPCPAAGFVARLDSDFDCDPSTGAQYPFVYDALVQSGDFGWASIIDVAQPSVEDAVTGSLRWSGNRARAANGNAAPALDAPDPIEPGSSIGHLDRDAFEGHLMAPFLRQGETHLEVPALTKAMLQDLGWTLPSADSPPTASERANAFVEAVARDFLGRGATSAERSRWSSHLLGGGSRDVVTAAFAYSDEWVGVIVDGFYRSTLGRGPDASGRAHWISVIRSGRTPAEVASYFYASDEYFRRSGSSIARWVDDLYVQILGRRSDAGGRAFWIDRTRAVGRTSVAYDFFQSLESRTRRVEDLYRRLLGRGPDSGGWTYWAGILSDGRDVELARFLAASEEYRRRAESRFAG